MNVPRNLFKQFLRLDRLVSAAYLACLIIFAYRFMRPMLFRTWFFFWDEYVYAAEVMRFSSLDFHQRFFDNPGTPFMMLSALIWDIFYAGTWALGFISPDTRIGLFTYHNVPLLFTVMRTTTLVFFLLSPILLFWLCARLTNKATAAIASLLLVLSPVYCSYSSFVRTESLAVVLILGALLWLNRGIDRAQDDFAALPGIRDYATVAGMLTGVAAGARLHSMTAALPVLAITLWLNKACRKPDYPAWIVRWSRYALPLFWAASVLLVIYMRVAWAELPAAVRLLTSAAWGSIGLSASAFLLYRLPRTKALVVRILSPDHVKLLLGFGTGFVLSNPTIFMQREHFFRSIEMYSGYLDRDRLAWPFLKNLTWSIGHYLDVVAPDRLTLVLLCIGCITILATCDRKMLPYLVGAGLFFFSKPLTVVASPHHVIPWLPFFFMVCAYPAGKLCQLLSDRIPHGNRWAAAGLVCLLFFSCTQLTVGPGVVLAEGMVAEARMRNIERATAWIKTHAEQKATVAITLYCVNPDGFYALMNSLGVPLPPEAFDGRDYVIWWGHGPALDGKTGYACVTRTQITKLDLTYAGEGTNPYTDPRFTPAASFGSGADEVDLFRFDYR
jgi:hypothetical protein